jgi:hypothetical protein
MRLLLALLLAAPALSLPVAVPASRPAYADRTFHSPSVDSFIDSLSKQFLDSDMATLFANTFPNTLDTTVADPDSGFIITGDIDAMWLRDSCNQVQPYLPFLAEDPALDTLLVNLVDRMARSVLIDPFANAFNPDDSKPGDHADDVVTPEMTNGVFESKYGREQSSERVSAKKKFLPRPRHAKPPATSAKMVSLPLLRRCARYKREEDVSVSAPLRALRNPATHLAGAGTSWTAWPRS